MSKQYLTFFFAITALFCLPECNKRYDNGGTFTVKGRWLKDCSGAAHANEALDISLVRYGINSKSTFNNIGSGRTDSSGYFSIVCDNHGSGDLSLKSEEGGVGDLPAIRRGWQYRRPGHIV